MSPTSPTGSGRSFGAENAHLLVGQRRADPHQTRHCRARAPDSQARRSRPARSGRSFRPSADRSSSRHAALSVGGTGPPPVRAEAQAAGRAATRVGSRQHLVEQGRIADQDGRAGRVDRVPAGRLGPAAHDVDRGAARRAAATDCRRAGRSSTARSARTTRHGRAAAGARRCSATRAPSARGRGRRPSAFRWCPRYRRGARWRFRRTDRAAA